MPKLQHQNRFEAEKITGIEIKSIEDARKVAKVILDDLGARAAVVRGGHIEGMIVQSFSLLIYRMHIYLYVILSHIVSIL